MNTWTDGYVAEVGYTFGYYPELNPLSMRLLMLYAGLAYPQVGTACELGFGQGLSVAVHAAASDVAWHGTDFNPAQAALARELVAAGGSGAALQDASFADYCARSDLPDFDFIALHGIWTWVSDANRQVLVDFLARKLRPGGVVFLSQNALPGWAAMAGVRRLMADHAQSTGGAGDGLVPKVDAALDFVDKVLAAQPAGVAGWAELAQRVGALRQLDKHYLAHEYFNQAWQPMYFSELAGWLARGRLGHACSARPLDHLPALGLTQAQFNLLSQVADPVLRETVRDFMVQQQFRKDYWVRGARRLTPFDQSRLMREQRVVLLAHRPELPLVVKTAGGEAALNRELYEPLLDALADHQARSLGELEARLAGRGVAFAALVQAVLVLVGQGRVAAARTEAEAAQARPRTDALNRHLMHLARGSGEIGTLASPVTGGGIAVLRAAQLFLLARSQGLATPQEWARFAWSLVGSQGQGLLGKDGKPLVGAEDNLAHLQAQAEAFAEKQLPMLQALQVA